METTPSQTSKDRILEARKSVDAALEKLSEALRQGKPADLVAYLNFWSRFRSYSFHNALLILSQRPDATRVAGFHAWRKVGRFVRKGERGIAILYPRIRAREDQATGETERFLSGFGVGYVFDVTSTDGQALPEPPAWREKGPVHQGDIERVAGAIRSRGIRLDFGQVAVELHAAGADGVTYQNGDGLAIAVRDDFEPAHIVRAMLHELGHAMLHFGPDRPVSREQRELEADAVAVAVAAALGYDFTQTAYRYLAGWSATPEDLLAVLPRIGRGVQAVLQALGFAGDEQREEAALPARAGAVTRPRFHPNGGGGASPPRGCAASPPPPKAPTPGTLAPPLRGRAKPCGLPSLRSVVTPARRREPEPWRHAAARAQFASKGSFRAPASSREGGAPSPPTRGRQTVIVRISYRLCRCRHRRY